jgi:hypothetical protein
MADKKVTQLAAQSAIGVDDLLYVVEDPLGTATSKKITFDNLQKSVNTNTALVGMNQMFDAMQSFDKVVKGTTYVGITGFGDSMIGLAYTPQWFMHGLYKKYGMGAYGTADFGHGYGTAWTLAGGAARNTADFSYIPTAVYYTVPTAGSMSIAFNPQNISFLSSATASSAHIDGFDVMPLFPRGVRKVKVFAITEPGAGTLNAALAQTVYTDVTGTLDCNTTLGVSTIELIPKNKAGNMVLTLTSTGGTVKVLGALYYNDSGIVYIHSGCGGSTMTQQAACLSGGAFKKCYTDLMTACNVKLVIHRQRVYGDADYSTNYDTFFNAYAALGVSQWVWGEPFTVDAQSPTVAIINDVLKQKTKALNISYSDPEMFFNPTVDTTINWAVSGDVHHLPAMHRYEAQRFLNQVDYFRSASSFTESQGYGEYGIKNWRHHFQPMNDARTKYMLGLSGVTVTSGTSGGYSFAVDGDYAGFKATSTATTGYAVARLGNMPLGSVYPNFTLGDFSIACNGYRNVSMTAGLYGFIGFGLSTSILTTLTSITRKSFGLQFASGADVGAPFAAADNLVRIWYCDGTNFVTSSYCNCVGGGEGGSATTGYNFVLAWDVVDKYLYLYHSTNGGYPSINNDAANAFRLRMALEASGLYTATQTELGQVQIGLYSEGTTPTAAGSLSFNSVIGRWGHIAPPYYE